MFRGTTLRSMLLTAYGFWKMGEIALWGAIASFIGAGLMLILAAFGFAHTRRVAPEAEVMHKLTAGTTASSQLRPSDFQLGPTSPTPRPGGPPIRRAAPA